MMIIYRELFLGTSLLIELEFLVSRSSAFPFRFLVVFSSVVAVVSPRFRPLSSRVSYLLSSSLIVLIAAVPRLS